MPFGNQVVEPDDEHNVYKTQFGVADGPPPDNSASAKPGIQQPDEFAKHWSNRLKFVATPADNSGVE